MLTGQHAYEEARSIAIQVRGAGFYPLMMATLRVADTENVERIRLVFPDVVAEVEARDKQVGGKLDAYQEVWIESIPRPPLDGLGGEHCLHWQEGGGDCCRCGLANWCPPTGSDSTEEAAAALGHGLIDGCTPQTEGGA